MPSYITVPDLVTTDHAEESLGTAQRSRSGSPSIATDALDAVRKAHDDESTVAKLRAEEEGA